MINIIVIIIYYSEGVLLFVRLPLDFGRAMTTGGQKRDNRNTRWRVHYCIIYMCCCFSDFFKRGMGEVLIVLREWIFQFISSALAIIVFTLPRTCRYARLADWKLRTYRYLYAGHLTERSFFEFPSNFKQFLFETLRCKRRRNKKWWRTHKVTTRSSGGKKIITLFSSRKLIQLWIFSRGSSSTRIYYTAHRYTVIVILRTIICEYGQERCI